MDKTGDNAGASMREELRKIGGEKLVAQFDYGRTVEEKIVEEVNAILERHMDEAPEEFAQAVAMSSCEAMSHLLSATVVATFVVLNGKDNIDVPSMVTTAVKSLVANLQSHIEAIELAEAGNAADMIKAAAEKVKGGAA